MVEVTSQEALRPFTVQITGEGCISFSLPCMHLVSFACQVKNIPRISFADFQGRHSLLQVPSSAL